jgi:hypothetical protein
MVAEATHELSSLQDAGDKETGIVGAAWAAAFLEAVAIPKGSSEAPHWEQNRASGGSCCWQAGQMTARLVPQFRQNRDPGGLWWLQLGHRIEHPALQLGDEDEL